MWSEVQHALTDVEFRTKCEYIQTFKTGCRPKYEGQSRITESWRFSKSGDMTLSFMLLFINIIPAGSNSGILSL